MAVAAPTTHWRRSVFGVQGFGVERELFIDRMASWNDLKASIRTVARANYRSWQGGSWGGMVLSENRQVAGTRLAVWL